MRTREQKLEYLRNYGKQRRANLTPEQLQEERRKGREYMRAKAANETPDERAERLKRQAESRKKHIEKRRADCREWRTRNKEKVAEYNKNWYAENQQYAIDLTKQWKKNNKEYLRKKVANLYASDIRHRITVLLRTRVATVLRRRRLGQYKSDKTIPLLGCSITEFMSHLESQFQPGMSWGNYGQWHIDHIKPCAMFDLRLDTEQKLCFNFSNMQPLWAKDNLAKGCRFVG